jgi:hypothetical protein
MELGQSTLDELRTLVASDERATWIRAVAANVDGSPGRALVAHVIVGPHPESWRPRIWHYESCTFVEGAITSAQLVESMSSESSMNLLIGSETLEFQVSPFNASWQHKPSLAPYDQPQVPYPSRVYTLRLANSETMNAPSDFLVGQGDVRSFSIFSVAFDEFFRGGTPASGSTNPLLGEMSIRIVDERARIEGVQRVDDHLEVRVAGSSLFGALLEFSSQLHSEMKHVTGPAIVNFDLPGNEVPRESWIWLKKDGDWLDYRHLQPWGAYMSPDVDLGTEDLGISSVANVTTQTPGARWLRDRAVSSTNRALSFYVNGDIRDFLLFAGQAIELACKALLADQNLAFLAPERSFSAALTLWKFRDDIERLPTGTPTIGPKEAFQRLVTLHPAMEELRSGVTELLAQRNGEVHLGVIDATTQGRTIVSFVKAMNLLLSVSEEEFDQFWSPHNELVKTILDDNAMQVQRAVQLKISAAIEQFKVIQTLPSEQRDAVLSMISNQRLELEIDEAEVKCPACKSVALASGANEVEVGDVSVRRDGTIEGVESWITFTPLSLKCQYCGLHLENRAELVAAGIESSWINDDEDVKQAIMEIGPSVYEYLDLSDYEVNEDDEH